MKVRSKIIAVDFDGTLCESVWPGIGRPKRDVINYVKRQQEEGAKIILWSCRTGEALDEAAKWCMEHGLYFDAVNENLPEAIDIYGRDSGKIFADEYVDDKARYVSYIARVETTVDDKLVTENSELKRKFELLTKALNDSTDENRRLKERNEKLTRELDDLSEDYDNLVDEKESVELALQDVKRSNKALYDQKDMYLKTIKGLGEKVAELQDKLDDMEHCCMATEDKVEELKKTNKSLATENTELFHRVNAAGEEMGKLYEDNESLSIERDNLQKLVDKYEANSMYGLPYNKVVYTPDGVKINGSYYIREAAHHELIGKLHGEIADLERRNKSQRDVIREKKRVIDATVHTIRELKEENEKLKKDNAKKDEVIQQFKKINMDLHVHIQGKNALLDMFNDALMIHELKKDNERLKETLFPFK